jgi:UDP-galactopyranose mutase
MSPENKTCLVIEVPVGENGLDDSSSKKMIYKKILNYLIDKKLLDLEKIINYKIVKVNDAYPVISTDSLIHIEKIKEYLLTIKNLHLVGRNSDFEYIHTHDIMRRSKTLVNKMVSL